MFIDFDQIILSFYVAKIKKLYKESMDKTGTYKQNFNSFEPYNSFLIHILMPPGSVDDLRTVIALSEVPDEHLQWLVDKSQYVEYEDGTLILKTGDPAENMIFIVEGKVMFYLNVGDKLVYYFTFENEIQSGGAGGLLPYSRMKTMPGNSYASGKVRGYMLHKKYFQELEQLNPDLIQRLIGYMTERARTFATQKLQHEKVNALGQLAAGIAHELNNPAAAINRISAELTRRLWVNYDLTEAMLKKNVSPATIRNVQRIIEVKKSDTKKKKLSPLRKIETEDEISGWLEKNSIRNDRQLTETLTESGFTTDELENIRVNTDAGSFNDLLLWLENSLSSQSILKDLDEASNRISTLVGAIKSHVHMDRTNEKQPTNVHTDLDNTVTLLGYKLRDKNISVNRSYCSDLKDVHAYIGELNQVWSNLIDNAIYAMDKNGELTIKTECNDKELKVHFIDNGKGIPQEIMSRIFDPFFTTKKVGEGSGIGLDLVSRIIKRHHGDVKVHSVPGRTEFTICLPLIHAEQKVQS
jgi:signal transduction histidine kinase